MGGTKHEKAESNPVSLRHAKEEIGQPDTKVVATGGLSRLVADNTELIDVVDPQLVLDGLRIIYERARR